MKALKTLAKSVYQKVVQDEYIEPLSFQQVYAILTKTYVRKRNASIKNQNGKGQNDKPSIMEDIEKYSTISTQKQIKRLGNSISYQQIQLRIKQLGTDLSEIQNLMVSNYQIYKLTIDKSLKMAQSNKSLQISKQKCKQLKYKLNTINKVAKHTKKISHNNIKIKNIKATIQILKLIPNIHKMSLNQLKNLQLDDKVSKLSCLKHLEQYIQKQVSNQLKGVIEILKKNILNFNHTQYESAVYTFAMTDHPTIKFEKLMVKIVQNQIRNFNSEIQQNLSFFIKIMINLHKICSWHRDDDSQTFFKQLKKISFNRDQIQTNVSRMMDQTLCSIIYQIVNAYDLKNLYELCYKLNRFFQIGYHFCGYIYKDTIKQLKMHINRKVKLVAQKCLNEFIQNVYMQDSNDWARLPIPNDYRHQGIEKYLCTLKKYEQSLIYNQVEHNKLIYLHQRFQTNTKQQSWEIQQLQLPQIQNIQKFRDQVKLQFPYEVVLCQSGLNILKHFENLSYFLFYLPIVQQTVLETMITLAEYYMYFIYGCFLSGNLKDLITSTNFEKIDERYLQRRIIHKYGHLVKFVKRFQSETIKLFPNIKMEIKQVKKLQKIIIRSRVISTESVKFILANLSHIIHSTTHFQSQSVQNLKVTVNQLIQYLFVDCIPKICSIESSVNIVSGIKWGQQRDYQVYLNALESLMKDFYNKIKGLGKGEIPQNIIESLFGVYWKTQITFMFGTFIKDFRIGKTAKARFQKFLDDLYTRILSFHIEQILNEPYKRIKKIFTIIYQSQWAKVLQLIKTSLSQYEYILRLTLNIFYCSESSMGLTQKQLKDREEIIIKWVQNNCFK